jgi:signal transduction histidine kinase
MGLSDFIIQHSSEILSEFVEFAKTQLPAADAMDVDSLRDHAAEVLADIAKDMKQPQTPREQFDKSQGSLDDKFNASGAAEIHGTLRAAAGFNVNQTAAEYRALRASVLRLWFESNPVLGRMEVFELVRFNEAMDEALAESILYFAAEAARMRNMFLGVLSHELRTPLSTITMSGRSILLAANAQKHLPGAPERLLRGAKRIESLLDNLLDYVRSGLGEGMRITLSEVDTFQLCEKIIAELAALHPTRDIQLACSGDPVCMADDQRLSQAISNLITNANKYGAPARPIRVQVDGSDASQLSISVQNDGPPIPAETLATMFQPLVRGVTADRTGVNLGLGLYIVREIASAHGGAASVESNEALGTVFTVCIPRVSTAASTGAFAGLRMK